EPIDNGISLQLAQAFVQDPLELRPPAITSFSLYVYNTTELDLATELQTTLATYSIAAAGVIEESFLGQNGVMAAAYSPDGLFFGMGKATQLPDGRVIVFVGRSVADTADTFQQLFTIIETSMVTDTTISPTPPQYGINWITESTAADGETAFLDLADITLAPHNDIRDGVLFAVDSFPQVGLIQINPHNGMVENQYAIPDEGLAQALVASSDGTIYVADVVCGCVQEFQTNSGWQQPVMSDFSADAPYSLTVDNDGNLYATDILDGEIVVRVYRNGQEETITFSEPLFSQPLLATNRANQVFALDESGELFSLEDGVFVSHTTLNTTGNITDVAFDAFNRPATTSSDGIFIFDAQGEVIENIGNLIASPDSFVAGDIYSPRSVAISADNTIYVVDSDGTYSRINAFNRGIAQHRLGNLQLVSDVVVGGTLTRDSGRHSWLFAGNSGEEIVLSAIDASGFGAVNVALRLYAPDGQEIAFNLDADSEEAILPTIFDAQLGPLTLPTSGIYYVAVEREDGEGDYRLALTTTKNSTYPATLNGFLEEAIPRQRWQIEFTAGDTIHITLAAQTANLDPIIRLYGADGSLIAENDDGEFIAPDAELIFTVPNNGVYLVEATRFSGFGPYLLTIEGE
ncbi:MAG: hypothetical protein D6712_08535, partial [Chloroflexi bacterium]